MTTQAKYVAHMGERLGKRYDELWKELVWLNTKWAQFVQLFGSKPERLALLNGTAPLFFRVVQDTLLEDVILHIARLTEHSKTKGRSEKLTTHTLPGLVDPRIRQAVSYGVKTAQHRAATCLDWRHRHIAHRNVALALGEAEPLGPVTLKHIRDALASIAEVLNEVHRHYMDGEIGFELLGQGGGAEDLLRVLDEGVRAVKDRQERMHGGDILPEDLVRREL